MSTERILMTSQSDLPKQVKAFPRGASELLKECFAAARKLNPAVSGLVAVSPKWAVFQVFGDSTRYLVSVTPAEAKALGWINI